MIACDICGSTERVQHVNIYIDRQRADSKDLCGMCLFELSKMMTGQKERKGGFLGFWLDRKKVG